MSQKLRTGKNPEFISFNPTSTATEAQKEDKATADEMTDNHYQTYKHTVS